MKNKYNVPTVKIINLSVNDIITTSGGDDAVLPDDEF